MENNIIKRLSAISNEMARVAKGLSVSTGRGSYKAVSEGDILGAVKPLEKKYGVYSYPIKRSVQESHVFESKDLNGNAKRAIYMRVETIYRFANVDDPTDFIEVTSYGDGVDTGDKASGKAMTYADKYALMKAYKIETGDDPDQWASNGYWEK